MGINNKKSGRLIMKMKDILLKLINLINGYKRIWKIKVFHRLIDTYNYKNDNKYF